MSSGRFGEDAVRASFWTLGDYLRDLLAATETTASTIATRFNSFSTKLRLVVNYVERDDVARWLARALHEGAAQARAWYREAVAGRAPALPASVAERLALRFGLLADIKRGAVDLRGLVSTLYGERGSFETAFEAFRREFLQPFVDELDRLMRLILQCVAARPASAFDEIVQEALRLLGPEEALPPAEPAPAPAEPGQAPARPAAAGRTTARKRSAAASPAGGARAGGAPKKKKSGEASGRTSETRTKASARGRARAKTAGKAKAKTASKAKAKKAGKAKASKAGKAKANKASRPGAKTEGKAKAAGRGGAKSGAGSSAAAKSGTEVRGSAASRARRKTGGTTGSRGGSRRGRGGGRAAR
ncbi:MAG: hypothetical protein KatS3mg102_0875 [Planctomycetota bacterium]|nr:MAG: hypothetical protein KatS3mg102_0875 [Planctomycetota bacterium]